MQYIEGVCYRETNGQVKPDAIQTVVFLTDPGILPKTQAESVCNTPADLGPLSKSTGYCYPFSTEITKTDGNGSFLLRSSRVGSSLEFSLLVFRG